MSIQQKISALLAMPGWTQAKLADALGVSQSTVNRWTKGTAPEGDHRDALADLYAEVYGLSAENNKMRIRGVVGVGQEVSLIDRAEQDWVDRPPSDFKNLTALRVQGDTLLPYCANWWILFHGDAVAPADVRGEIVVAQLTDGRQFVRQLRQGSSSDTWTLSIPSASDMVDVEIERAFPIVWIKPHTKAFAPF